MSYSGKIFSLAKVSLRQMFFGVNKNKRKVEVFCKSMLVSSI
jgi:hypothetical protein